MQPPRRSFAVAQTAVAIGTFAWAGLLMYVQAELFWPATTLAAGLFFVVAAFLFGQRHPDAPTVGLFGLLFMVIANVILPFADPTIRGDRLGAVLGIVLVILVTEGLLLYGAYHVRRTAAPPGA